MSLLSILKYPDERLNIVAEPVIDFDDNLKRIIENMTQTMYQSNGIGLAATQVNLHKRIVVIDVSRERNSLLALINPEITMFSTSKDIEEEGCLSINDTYEKVERPCMITCKFHDQDGEYKELEAEGLLSRCIQHEVDHLNGKLFIDRISPLKRSRISARIRKQNRMKTSV